MQLSDLFVSHKQVEPVTFTAPKMEEYQPLYINLNRAQQVTNPTPTEDTPEASEDIERDWKVGQDKSHWRVSGYEETPFTNTYTTSMEQQSGGKSVVPRWTSTYKGKKDLWISDMTAAYKRIGLSDNAIKNLIAKNALESGWGKSAQGAYNFGNITTGSKWTGKYVKGNDHNAAGEKITQKFRAYDSLDGYVADEIQFLTRLYDFNQNDDFDTFINKLQGHNKGKRRYAEDLQYANKVRQVYNSI